MVISNTLLDRENLLLPGLKFIIKHSSSMLAIRTIALKFRRFFTNNLWFAQFAIFIVSFVLDQSFGSVHEVCTVLQAVPVKNLVHYI